MSWNLGFSVFWEVCRLPFPYRITEGLPVIRIQPVRVVSAINAWLQQLTANVIRPSFFRTFALAKVHHSWKAELRTLQLYRTHTECWTKKTFKPQFAVTSRLRS